MLSARDVSKTLCGRPVLSEIDCDVSPGEITVIVGPSGAGKSTLLRVLAFLEAPDKGILTFDLSEMKNHRVDFSKEVSLRVAPWPRITAVFQQLFLWPYMTLRQNILLPAQSLGKTGEEQILRELNSLIAELNLTGSIDRFPNETSLGERQRAALARAILLNPSYLLLDEITSSLDIEQIGSVLAMLPNLKSRGIGLLLVTHLIEFAKRTADQVVFMDNGRIVETGSVDVLCRPQSERMKRFISAVEAAR